MAAYYDDNTGSYLFHEDDCYDNADHYFDDLDENPKEDECCYKGGPICLCDNDNCLYRSTTTEYFVEVKDVCEPKISIAHSGFNNILFEG